jgi:hypothetical protein
MERILAQKGLSFTNELFTHRPTSFFVYSKFFRFALLIGALILGHAGAVSATTWHVGDFTTFNSADWGDVPNGSNAASVLENNYAAVYAGTMDLFEIGIPGAAGFSALFTGSAVLLDYLPAAGTLGPFDTDLVDPTSTAAGQFGGDVAALKLNIDFSDKGVTPHNASVRFGDLHLFALTLTGLNGLSVRDFRRGLEHSHRWWHHRLHNRGSGFGGKRAQRSLWRRLRRHLRAGASPSPDRLRTRIGLRLAAALRTRSAGVKVRQEEKS